MFTNLFIAALSGAIGGHMAGKAMGKHGIGPAKRVIAGAFAGVIAAEALSYFEQRAFSAPLAGMEGAVSEGAAPSFLVAVLAGLAAGALMVAMMGMARKMMRRG